MNQKNNPMTPHIDTLKGWEKEFDKLYLHAHWMDLKTSDVLKNESLGIKSFINSLLTSAHTEWEAEMREKIDKLGSKEVEIDFDGFPKMKSLENVGYNQALSDVLSLLQSNQSK